MITGFNTDIDFEDRVFHVQTEDRGRSNPIIETLVYTGGQIVCARKTSYSELLTEGGYSEAVVHDRMETQHRELIRDIREGSFSKEDLQPFGGNVISNRSFDEVVRGFLEENIPIEQIRLEVLAPEELRAGGRQTLTLHVTEKTTERPLSGAQVMIKLVTNGGDATELISSRTDEAGSVEAACDIPGQPGAGAAVICEAEASGKRAQVRCRVTHRAPSSVSRA